MNYTSTLLNYFYHTPHAGTLNTELSDVHHVQVGHPLNMDVLDLYIQCEEEKIIAARFQAYGSPALIACAEFICSWLEGKTTEAALKITHQDILQALDLSNLKIHIAALVLSAAQGLLKHEVV